MQHLESQIESAMSADETSSASETFRGREGTQFIQSGTSESQLSPPGLTKKKALATSSSSDEYRVSQLLSVDPDALTYQTNVKPGELDAVLPPEWRSIDLEGEEHLASLRARDSSAWDTIMGNTVQYRQPPKERDVSRAIPTTKHTRNASMPIKKKSVGFSEDNFLDPESQGWWSEFRELAANQEGITWESDGRGYEGTASEEFRKSKSVEARATQQYEWIKEGDLSIKIHPHTLSSKYPLVAKYGTDGLTQGRVSEKEKRKFESELSRMSKKRLLTTADLKENYPDLSHALSHKRARDLGLSTLWGVEYNDFQTKKLSLILTDEEASLLAPSIASLDPVSRYSNQEMVERMKSKDLSSKQHRSELNRHRPAGCNGCIDNPMCQRHGEYISKAKDKHTWTQDSVEKRWAKREKEGWRAHEGPMLNPSYVDRDKILSGTELSATGTVGMLEEGEWERYTQGIKAKKLVDSFLESAKSHDWGTSDGSLSPEEMANLVKEFQNRMGSNAGEMSSNVERQVTSDVPETDDDEFERWMSMIDPSPVPSARTVSVAA